MLPYCSECESVGLVCTKCYEDYPYLLSSKKGCTDDCTTDFGFIKYFNIFKKELFLKIMNVLNATQD